jgi:hypothetical protein
MKLKLTIVAPIILGIYTVLVILVYMAFEKQHKAVSDVSGRIGAFSFNDTPKKGSRFLRSAYRVISNEPEKDGASADEDAETTKLPNYPITHRNKNASTLKLTPYAITQCHKALWHTLETTTSVLENNETFVKTGDIEDMWLRDSAAQIHPLLLPNVYEGQSLVQLDPKLERVVSGLILKTARMIRHDPYANAFSSYKKEHPEFDVKVLGRHGYVATRNYELDSGCYFMRMMYYFYQNFPGHPILKRIEVREAVQIMVDV